MTSDLSVHQVKESLRNFLLNKGRKNTNKCELCVKKHSTSNSGEIGQYPLSEQEVGVVLSALSFPQEGVEFNGRNFGICAECATSLTTLVELFIRLEELRVQFNQLRRRVWKRIILGSLEENKVTWYCWEKELIRLDDFYPSYGFGNVKFRNEDLKCGEDRGDCASNLNFLPEKESWLENDPKLKKMTPVVMLERLEESLHCKTWTNFTRNVKNEPQSEVLNLSENTNDEEDTVAHGDVDIKNESTSDEFNDQDYEIISNEVNEKDKEEEEEECQRSSSTNSPKSDGVSSQTDGVETIVPPKPQLVEVKSYSCSHCDMTFTRRYAMLKHIEKLHEKQNSEDEEKEERSRRFQCRACPQSFTAAPNLFRHRANLHPEQMKRQCPSCPKHFERLWALLEHQKKAHNYIPPPPLATSRECPICSRVFSNVQSCRRHVAIVHEKTQKVSMKCPHCSFSCRHQKWMRKHFYKVHPEEHLKINPHHCRVCFLTFRSVEELESHMERHASIKCPTCAKYLPTTVHLRNHMKVHLKSKAK